MLFKTCIPSIDSVICVDVRGNRDGELRAEGVFWPGPGREDDLRIELTDEQRDEVQAVLDRDQIEIRHRMWDEASRDD